MFLDVVFTRPNGILLNSICNEQNLEKYQHYLESMAYSPKEENGDIPRVGKYNVLRKNFVKEVILSTLFLVSFAGTFMIGWDYLIIPSDFHRLYVFYCISAAFLVAIILTSTTSFLINYIKRKSQEKKRKKQEQKDFLNQ